MVNWSVAKVEWRLSTLFMWLHLWVEIILYLSLWCRPTTFHARRTSHSPRHWVNRSRSRRGTSLVYHETASLWITESLLPTLGDGRHSDCAVVKFHHVYLDCKECIKVNKIALSLEIYSTSYTIHISMVLRYGTCHWGTNDLPHCLTGTYVYLLTALQHCF